MQFLCIDIFGYEASVARISFSYWTINAFGTHFVYLKLPEGLKLVFKHFASKSSKLLAGKHFVHMQAYQTYYIWKGTIRKNALCQKAVFLLTSESFEKLASLPKMKNFDLSFKQLSFNYSYFRERIFPTYHSIKSTLEHLFIFHFKEMDEIS